MNNEPVAWMQTWENQDGFSRRTVNIEQIGKNDIPLYTHPVKEQDTECQYCKQGCIRCDARKQLTDEEIIELFEHPDDFNCIDFARAILRKASEK